MEFLATASQPMPRRSAVDEDVAADADDARRLWEVRQALRQPAQIQSLLRQIQRNHSMRKLLRLSQHHEQFRQDHRRNPADALQAEFHPKVAADPRQAQMLVAAMQRQFPNPSSHPRRNLRTHLQEASVLQLGKDADARENLRLRQDLRD
jgi:hypothetical protein